MAAGSSELSEFLEQGVKRTECLFTFLSTNSLHKGLRCLLKHNLGKTRRVKRPSGAHDVIWL